MRDLRPGSFEEARLSLYVMGRDGSDRRRITFGNGLDRRPCFGPDGDLVAFLSNRSGSQDLWVTVAGADAEPRCLEVDRQGWKPARPWFAADASVIYFYARRRGEGRDRICCVPAGGGPVEPLAQDDRGDSHGPFVDWDGRSLLMHSTREARSTCGRSP